MIFQCRACKMIRIDKVADRQDLYWLPHAQEIAAPLHETYCPRCASEILGRIQRGEFAAGTVKQVG